MVLNWLGKCSVSPEVIFEEIRMRFSFLSMEVRLIDKKGTKAEPTTEGDKLHS